MGLCIGTERHAFFGMEGPLPMQCGDVEVQSAANEVGAKNRGIWFLQKLQRNSLTVLYVSANKMIRNLLKRKLFASDHTALRNC
jgi:hypothetical protein